MHESLSGARGLVEEYAKICHNQARPQSIACWSASIRGGGDFSTDAMRKIASGLILMAWLVAILLLLDPLPALSQQESGDSLQLQVQVQDPQKASESPSESVEQPSPVETEQNAWAGALFQEPGP